MEPQVNREEEFIRRLVEAQNALKGYILAHVGDEAQAQDILQDVSVTLWKKYDRYCAERSFLNWALGVARYQVLNAYRRSSRSRVIFDEQLAEKLADRYEALEPELEERRTTLQVCLDALSAEARKLVDLRYGLGLSMGAVAKKAGKAINAVTVALSRIRASLVKCVERQARDEAGEFERI